MEPILKPSARSLKLMVLAALATAGVAAVLVTIVMHKVEEQKPYTQVAPVDESTDDPAVWGLNFPHQYDSYKKTALSGRTRFGGSEAFSHLESQPHLKAIFNGYAFGVDYNEERGHAYTLASQKETKRVSDFKQPGACLHCHASVLPLYRELGEGDVMKGFAKANPMPLKELHAHPKVKHPVSCLDCHDPKTNELRITRPGFLEGIKVLKASEGVKDYDPNKHATRQELRSFACAQCHVEYYFKGDEKRLTYPWHNGLKMEDAEAYYDQVKHVDWIHADSGAPVLKAQHPEFELFSQGIHAKNGVACADCHMPYMRAGAAKVSDHHVRSPLLNVRKACLNCHSASEDEMTARVIEIQNRTKGLMDRSQQAVVDLIRVAAQLKAAGASAEDMKEVHALQRKAQWRADYVNAENSMGFHAPQEAARILGEAIDYARQGELKANQLLNARKRLAHSTGGAALVQRVLGQP
jgi:nitrite reductase (cytochrome c-552)